MFYVNTGPDYLQETIGNSTYEKSQKHQNIDILKILLLVEVCLFVWMKQKSLGHKKVILILLVLMFDLFKLHYQKHRFLI